jgi:hypothetical protein
MWSPSVHAGRSRALLNNRVRSTVFEAFPQTLREHTVENVGGLTNSVEQSLSRSGHAANRFKTIYVSASALGRWLSAWAHAVREDSETWL